MTATATVPRGTRAKACARDKAGCKTHEAVWPAAEEVCWAVSGKGPDVPAAWVKATIADVPLDLVDVGDNVRVNIAELEELTASIQEHGVLQPVKVVIDGARYRLVWGQRRVLAAQAAGLERIPAIVDEATSEGSSRSIEQLVENLHRADLNPIDRARAMRAVVDAGLSQADLARKLGIAPSTVANDLRLLTLDDQVLERIVAGDITAAHGKAIASLPAKQQRELVKAIVDEKLSAHALEGRIRWKTDEAGADDARAKRTDKWIPKILGALEAAAVPKNAPISLRGASHKLDERTVRLALVRAGWTNQDDHYRLERAKGCDCTAVGVDCGGLKPTILAVCSNDAHGSRAPRRDWEAERKAREEQLDRFRDAVRYELAVARPRGRLVRVLAWMLEQSGWYLSPEERETRWKALQDTPDEDVLDRLADAIAREQHARSIDVDAFATDVAAAGWKGHAAGDPAPGKEAAATD